MTQRQEFHPNRKFGLIRGTNSSEILFTLCFHRQVVEIFCSQP